MIALAPPDNGFYGLSRVLTFTLAWSEPITATGSLRLPLTIGTTEPITRYAATAGGRATTTLVFTYTTRAGDNGPIGLVAALDLNGGAIRDRAANNATLTLPVVDAAGIVVDTTAPTLTLVIPPAAGLYRAGATLDWLTRWSEPLMASGAPSATLLMGASPVSAGFLSGSGTVTLTFRYGVKNTDHDADGVSLTGFAVTAGTLRDRAGNAAVVTVTVPYTSAAIVDTRPPTVTTFAAAPGWYGLNQNVPLTLTWNEPVTVTGGAEMQITLTVGAATRCAT